MKQRWLWIGGGVAAVLALVVALTAALVPQDEPAFAAAVAFYQQAAGPQGDEAAALALLSAPLQDFVRAHCPQGQVRGCVRGYTPAEWGALVTVQFRRAAPLAGGGWQVRLFSMYEFDKGFSGVCTEVTMQQQDGTWVVTRWAGFAHCGDVGDLRASDAPNAAP
jgi:hypothetical protein